MSQKSIITCEPSLHWAQELWALKQIIRKIISVEIFMYLDELLFDGLRAELLFGGNGPFLVIMFALVIVPAHSIDHSGPGKIATAFQVLVILSDARLAESKFRPFSPPNELLPNGLDHLDRSQTQFVQRFESSGCFVRRNFLSTDLLNQMVDRILGTSNG